MPRKPHHEVLVFKKTVWLSIYFDMVRGTQCWRTYKRNNVGTRGGWDLWWLGLVPKGYIREE